MQKTPAPPRPIGALTTFLLVLLSALGALFLPATGLAATGPLHASPVELVFPKTTVHRTAEGMAVTVTNESGGPFSLGGPSIVGDPTDFGLSSTTCGSSLGSGASCVLTVEFQPQSAGAKQATLRLPAGAEQEDVPLEGTAVPPALTFQPAGHDFGPVRRYSSAEFAFEAVNSGEAAVQVGNLEVVSSGEYDLSLGSGACFGVLLEPGESCSVPVRFSPGKTIAYTGTLEVEAGGQMFTAALSGRGGEPVVTGPTAPVRFGQVAVGSSSLAQTITLTNRGDLPGEILVEPITVQDGGSFRLIDDQCAPAPLAPGADCTLRVVFTPTGAGPKKTTLLASAGGPAGPAEITLEGEGVAPALKLSRHRFDFGSLPPGTRGRARAFALHNLGSTPIELGTAAIVGRNLGEFVLTSDNCTGATLQPGGVCRVRVRFAPRGGGNKRATLRIDAQSGALMAALRGDGESPSERRAAH